MSAKPSLNTVAVDYEPPNSIVAEQAVLGSLLIDNDCYHDVSAIITDTMFYKKIHRFIYKAVQSCLAIHGSADVVTLHTLLKEYREYTENGGIVYLNTIFENTPTSSNASVYANIVRQKYDERTALAVLYRALELIQTDKEHGLKNALTQIEKLSSKPTSSKKIFTHIGELLKNRVSVSWLIRDYLPIDSTCMLYGESGAGKSFLMLDMALHVATGTEWLGHKTKKTAVFYIAGEGQSGITSRCLAWSLHHQIEIAFSPFYLTDKAIIPTDENELRTLISNVSVWIEETGESSPLIVFDTLARCFDGDENKQQDASRYVRAMDELRTRFNACVISVHHSGKDATKGARGSTAFKGAWNAELCLSKMPGDDTKKLSCSKMKDAKEPDDVFFKLESVATNWMDDDFNTVYSAVMIPSDYSSTDDSKKQRIDVTTQNILTALHKAILDKGQPAPSFVHGLFENEPGKAPELVISIDKFRPYAYPYFDCAEDSKRKALTRVIKKLESIGKVMFYNDCLWLS